MRPPVRATYRVQLSTTFDLDDAAGIVGYLADLGVSHLYTSPLFEATAGSTHGYDVTDPAQVRAELGGEPALRRLWGALADHGMGQVVDLVSNHMGIRSPANRWWQDVLRQGRASPFADHFDIDWTADGPDRGRVVLPFLGGPLPDVVRAGEVTVGRDGDGLPTAHHHDDRWPLSAESLAGLGIDPDDVEAVDGALDALRHRPDRLLDLLDQQHWVAVPWRETAARLNWRRFFDITDLAAVAVERPHVFDDVHELLREWVTDDPLATAVVQGVRVDHVDGLVDPRRYLERLRDLIGPDRLLLVEKILAADETCPDGWPADGTTGYEVMARLDEALTPPGGATTLGGAYREQTGDDRAWSAVEDESRRLVVHDLLAPETRRAAGALERALRARTPHIAPAADRCLDVTTELACAFDAYRVYPGAESTGLTDGDAARVEAAADRVRGRRPDLDDGLLQAAIDLLTGRRGPGPETDELGVRFAQLTAPLAAKAIEDTAFYRWAACAWRNEVGGDPGRLDPSTHEIHALLGTIAEQHPGTLVPLTTHDTKRSGDVRARLARLAEIPEAFADAVNRGHDAAREAAPDVATALTDPALEWLLVQSLVGAWPIGTERAVAYATKAAREAKTRTSWVDPDPTFEEALTTFVGLVVADPDLSASVRGVVASIRVAGRAASLAQVALATTVLGTPDVYQGDELWNLTLVDPDNRRPVDWDRRRATLDAVAAWTGPDLADRWALTRALPDDDGAVKLAVLHRLLALRVGPRPPLEPAARHRPIPVHGDDGEAVFAYARGERLVVVTPRRFLRPVQAEVDLPDTEWRDALTGTAVVGGRRRVDELTAALPVAVLVRP
jgi:(1->4)-alpha-D-glucan 1-alpha-D-glucosylmutase